MMVAEKSSTIADGIGQLARRQLRQERRAQPQDPHVGGHAPLDVGALNFDHHVAAIASARAVDLGDRRRRHGRLVDGGERRGDRSAQLGDQHRLDLGPRERRHPVEGLLKLDAVPLGKEPVRRSHQLPQLEIGGPQIFERAPHQLGPQAALAAHRSAHALAGVAREYADGDDKAPHRVDAHGEGVAPAHQPDHERRRTDGHQQRHHVGPVQRDGHDSYPRLSRISTARRAGDGVRGCARSGGRSSMPCRKNTPCKRS